MTCGALVDFSMPSKNLIAGVAAGLCEKRDFKNGAGVNEWLAMGEEGRADRSSVGQDRLGHIQKLKRRVVGIGF